MRMREDYRTLSGNEKAAIFLLALGEEHATKVFEHMDDEEILDLSQTMAGLGRVGPCCTRSGPSPRYIRSRSRAQNAQNGIRTKRSSRGC